MADIPDSIPWYRSAVLRGLLVLVVSQIFLRLKNQYHIDLTLAGLNADSIVSYLLDFVSAAAVAYAAHGRISKPLPPIE